MEFIDYQVNNRIGYIALNRPDKRNALNYQVVSELTACFKQAESDPNVKVIVLSGNGEAFCAGADLAYLQTLQTNTYEENLADSSHLKELFATIYGLKKVVIGMVTGHAIAGGAGLATVCDIVFSVPEAQFGYTEVKIGFIPAIVSIFLLRKIGESRTKELLLSGELISAQTALDYGLINFIEEKNTIVEKVNIFASTLLTRASGNSLELTKRLVKEAHDMDLNLFLTHAAEMNAEARQSADCKKGIRAFLNKEKISW